MKSLITLSGLTASDYAPHRFRIGAATFWAFPGKTDIQVISLGYWQSDAGHRYIRVYVLLYWSDTELQLKGYMRRLYLV